MNKDTALYLAHPYTTYPGKSYLNAQRWTYLLRTKGWLVFSPILHTHHYHHGLIGNFTIQDFPPHDTDIWKEYTETEDYVAWDLGLVRAMMAGDGRSYDLHTYYCVDCHKEIKWKNTRHEIIRCCEKPNNKHLDCYKNWYIKMVTHVHYDSGVALLLSTTAINTGTYADPLKLFRESTFDYKKHAKMWKASWHSQGCRQEYEFAKQHHIRVLALEAFLEGREVDL